MLIDKGLQKALKDKYPKISPEVKKKLLFPLMGAATVGVMAAHNYTAERQRRLVEQDE